MPFLSSRIARMFGASRAALCAAAVLVAPVAAHATALGNIWLVGDSITSGFTVAGAYRPQLYLDLTARGDTFRFVGSATNDSTALLNGAGQNHQEGHSGYAIATGRNTNGSIRQGIYDNVNSYYNNVLTTQGRPDIILLMIGTNDINSDIDPINAPARLELLVSRLIGLDPTAHLFVSSIAPARQGNLYMDPAMTSLDASIRAFNAAIPGIVSAHDALGQNVSFIDLYPALALTDLGSDGLHPTAAGYAKIGHLFAGALAVPEPATWALFAAGLLLLGWAMRRSASAVPRARVAPAIAIA